MDLVTYLGTYAVRGSHPLAFEVALELDGMGLEVSFDDRTPHI